MCKEGKWAIERKKDATEVRHLEKTKGIGNKGYNPKEESII